MRPLPGISADVIDDQARSVPDGAVAIWCLTEPWPSMLRGIWGDDQRYKDTYWSRYEGMYFAGDGAKKDEDGDLWLLGRVDDVMNVSGHRISTTEVESALVSHPAVAEAAVVGATDPTTGQGIVAFVIPRAGAEGVDDGEAFVKTLRDHVAHEIGPIAKPRQIMVVAELPKTRSGKIMRRLLRDVAEHRSMGDVTTLADPTVMQLIAECTATRGRDRRNEPSPRPRFIHQLDLGLPPAGLDKGSQVRLTDRWGRKRAKRDFRWGFSSGLTQRASRPQRLIRCSRASTSSRASAVATMSSWSPA